MPKPNNLAEGRSFLDGLETSENAPFGPDPLPGVPRDRASFRDFMAHDVIGSNQNALNGIDALVKAGGAFLNEVSHSPSIEAAVTVAIGDL